MQVPKCHCTLVQFFFNLGFIHVTCNTFKLGCITSKTISIYSGTPLFWTLWGPGEVSCIERCHHFRCTCSIKEAYLGHGKVSVKQRCPYFRDVIHVRVSHSAAVLNDMQQLSAASSAHT